jgi:prepilin-type processing-associated H-X9-DG protein
MELLVAMAIIALLAALLRRRWARPTARPSRCAVPATFASCSSRGCSTSDHQDSLPRNWTKYPTWDSDYRDGYSLANSWVTGSARLSDSTDGIRNGTLYPYTPNERMYCCPSDKSVWPYQNGVRRAPRPFNVALSIAMNGGYNDINGRAMSPLVAEKLAQVRLPSRWFTFIDEEAASMTSGAFFEVVGLGRWVMIPGCRDRNAGANVAFADGSVTFKKWLERNRTRTGSYTDPRNQQDRADLDWVLSVLCP